MSDELHTQPQPQPAATAKSSPGSGDPASIPGGQQQRTSDPLRGLRWSEELGKRVRPGEWADQGVSTVTKIEQASAEGRGEEAAQLIDYFVEEAKVCYEIYRVWFGGFVEWLKSAGVAEAEWKAEDTRLRRLLAFPDGTPFEPVPAWEDFAAAAGRLAGRARIGMGVQTEDLDGLREQWRRLHDRWVDLISGILTFVAERFGEAELERCYRYVLEPYIQERYMPFDLRQQEYEQTLYRNLYLSFEAMRAHLCGPGRRGEIGVFEDDDKWVLSFDPCGSCGRSARGDPIEGTPPRPEAPYNFGVTTEQHDWAWNEIGVGYYCAHCCLALERLPAERWGHPVRVCDCPLYPKETSVQPDGSGPMSCTWTIYKRIDAIPEEAYRRIGLVKPAAGEEGERARPVTEDSA